MEIFWDGLHQGKQRLGLIQLFLERSGLKLQGAQLWSLQLIRKGNMQNQPKIQVKQSHLPFPAGRFQSRTRWMNQQQFTTAAQDGSLLCQLSPYWSSWQAQNYHFAWTINCHLPGSVINTKKICWANRFHFPFGWLELFLFGVIWIQKQPWKREKERDPHYNSFF